VSAPAITDVDSFHAFEHAGWESNVAEYDSAFARLTSQSIEPLLDAVRAGPGFRLLDIACGPGYVAGAAAQRGAVVTGIDFSAPMVAHAKRSYPDVEFQEGDAEAIAFADDTFDAVVMNYGILHLARPERSMSEALRVLRPRGRFAFTAWMDPAEAIGFGIVLAALRTHGNMDVPVPEGPPFFRFGDPDECDRTLRAAGFDDIWVTRIPQVWRFNDPDGPFDAIFKGGVRIRAILKAQSEKAFRAVRAAARESTRARTIDGKIEIPMPAVIASGSKPA
jgi:SAM-dependent methyltransferase